MKATTLELIGKNVHPNVKLLVEALESDQYSQSQELLRDDDGFCCLGVICDLTDPFGWSQLLTFAGQNQFLPHHIAEHWGMNSIRGHFKLSREDNLALDIPKMAFSDDLNTSLAQLNDSYGLTFREIAKVIRSHHRTIFKGLYNAQEST